MAFPDWANMTERSYRGRRLKVNRLSDAASYLTVMVIFFDMTGGFSCSCPLLPTTS